MILDKKTTLIESNTLFLENQQNQLRAYQIQGSDLLKEMVWLEVLLDLLTMRVLTLTSYQETPC